MEDKSNGWMFENFNILFSNCIFRPQLTFAWWKLAVILPIFESVHNVEWRKKRRKLWRWRMERQSFHHSKWVCWFLFVAWLALFSKMTDFKLFFLFAGVSNVQKERIAQAMVADWLPFLLEKVHSIGVAEAQGEVPQWWRWNSERNWNCSELMMSFPVHLFVAGNQSTYSVHTNSWSSECPFSYLLYN